jgi:hypothetical protein
MIAAQLNPFEDALIEADIDNIRYLKTQYLNKSMVIQADDYLQISAKVNTATKKGNKKRLSVAENFIEVMDSHPTIQRSVSGYIHKESGTYRESLPSAIYARQYKKVEVRTIQPDKYTVVIYNGRDTLFIKIHKLAHFTGSRYRTLINTLLGCNVFVHKARVSNSTQKHKYNSMRLILQRDFGLHEYEWGFTFNAEISAFVAPALQRSAVLTLDGMSYLYPPLLEAGSGKNTVIQCRAKIYNVTAMQESRKGKPYQYIAGDLFKFEITYTSAFFKSKNHQYAAIPAFKTQRDIFSLLLKDNLGRFEKHVLKPLTCIEKHKLCKVTGIKTIGDFMPKLSDDVSLQTNVDIDRKMIIERFSALEKLIFERENITSKRHAEFCDFRAETREFIAQHQNNVDMRKLRENTQIVRFDL